MAKDQRAYTLRELKLELTYECRLNCVHCSSEASPSNRLCMAKNDAIRILQEATALGVEEVAFSGGEPLLWPDLKHVVSVCKAADMHVTIYSSGNGPEVHLQLRELTQAGTDRIAFGIHAAESNGHDRVTGVPGSFDRTMSAAQAAVDLGLDAEFHFVPMRDNYRYLPTVVGLAASMGVGRVSVLRLVPQGRGTEADLALTRPDYEKLGEMILSARAGFDVRSGSPFNFLLVNDSPECCAARDRLTVGPDLRIHPCDAFKQVQASDVAGTDAMSRLDEWSLEECWKGSPYLTAVRAYLTTPFAEPCSACLLLPRCRSGCLAQKYLAHGELVKCPDPMCLTATERQDMAGE